MKRVIIVHGWEGRPDKEWMPWLKRELEERGYNVLVPHMPNTLHPRLNTWFPYLKKIVKKIDINTFFVGHSLGCITILRYLESLKGNEKAGGAVLVAGFGHDLEYRDYRKEISSFFAIPLDWLNIKKHCKQFIAIHSKDDKWVPLRHNDIFKKELNAESVVVDGMGHFNVLELPLALEAVLKISK